MFHEAYTPGRTSQNFFAFYFSGIRKNSIASKSSMRKKEKRRKMLTGLVRRGSVFVSWRKKGRGMNTKSSKGSWSVRCCEIRLMKKRGSVRISSKELRPELPWAARRAYSKRSRVVLVV